MAPKRRSSETEQQIIKTGSLMKSPPPYLIGNRGSWKRRLFKLYKTMTDSYVITYYDYEGATEIPKKDILVSEIICIESGNNIKDKHLGTIERLFNMTPENVLHIKTESRSYYMIDNNLESIREWHSCITEVWMRMNQPSPESGPRIFHPFLSMPNHEQRPRSLPVEPLCSKTARDETLDRHRAHTDPDPRRGTLSDCVDSKGLICGNSPEQAGAGSTDNRRSLTYESISEWLPRNTETNRLSSASDQEPVSSRSSRSDYSSETDIYDVPRPRGAGSIDNRRSLTYESISEWLPRNTEPNRLSSASDQMESSDDPEEFSDTDISIYEPMNGQQTLPPVKSPRNSQVIEPRKSRKHQRSQLKKINIMQMWCGPETEADSVEMKIAPEHLLKHLTLHEAGERLYVSKWNGPADIGCIFHHADRIDAINGINLESYDFFTKILKQSIYATVNIVVMRKKNADIFHVEGCKCDRL